jgi:DNA-directed RNA polymerase specialized sigma24 family protein
MSAADSTCWTVITAAAHGGAAERDDFARRYAGPIRAYLAARWRGTKHLAELDDAVQEVFVECFRGGGALARVEVGRAGGFRAFLYGVVRHVGLRFEAGRAARGRGAGDGHAAIDFDALPADDPTLSRAFDRAWVQALLAMAVAAQEVEARARGDAAQRRVALLRRRFADGLPIREIAREWGVDAAVVHHEYARARDEFAAALKQAVRFHLGGDGTPGEVERQCAELAKLIDS